MEKRGSASCGRRADLSVRVSQCRTREQQLAQKLLRVVAAQLSRQRRGFALDASEEQLLARLHAVHALLNAPVQIKVTSVC